MGMQRSIAAMISPSDVSAYGRFGANLNPWRADLRLRGLI